MKSRTYGWVQNPSDFKKLKTVVQIFDSTSQHYKKLRTKLISDYIPIKKVREGLLAKLAKNIEKFSYTELVGTSQDITGKPAKTRKDAVADALIQVSISSQSAQTSGKLWTDNWSADGYLRWALSLNFVKHDRESDICSITELGKQFSKSADDSEDEIEILRQALLCYPPATQVLNILNSYSIPVNKFRIGNQLGFSGEKGFTSYDEDIMLNWFKTGTKDEQKKIKSDVEGTSDKYARMIASWLSKVGFVKKHTSLVDTINGEKAGFPEFSITGKGSHALKQAHGSSSNARVEKYLTWEFLAVDGKNKDYVRTRRAYLLKILQSTKSFTSLLKQLKDLGFNDDLKIIENDITGLNNFGIRIEKNNNSIHLKDKISDFSIPVLNITKKLKDEAIENLKVEFLNKTRLPMKYIELLEIAYDGKRNRDFEILTADLFKNIYGLNSILLGGSRKPDCVIFTNKFGVIIDTKAYENGYSKSISQEDEMVRYIEDNQYRDKTRNSTEWWEHFDKHIPSDKYYFLWVSSKFTGQFNEQLKSTSRRTNTKGAALNVEQLLLGAAAVKFGTLDINNIQNYINNTEIYWKNI